jgi:hypothetical protein
MVSVLLDAFDGGASCPCSAVDVAHRLPVRLDMFTSWMVGADESLIPLLMRAQIHMALIGGEVRSCLALRFHPLLASLTRIMHIAVRCGIRP